MGDEYKWKLHKNNQFYLIENVKTGRYLDSGPHHNHKCDGIIYTYGRAGEEQLFLLENMILQKNFNIKAIKETGCCFLACCFIGGLTTYEQCDDAYDWASKNNKIRGNDCFVFNKKILPKEISQKYGTHLKEGCEFVKENGHFYVIQNGIEVYNSAGIGWRGR